MSLCSSSSRNEPNQGWVQIRSNRFPKGQQLILKKKMLTKVSAYSMEKKMCCTVILRPVFNPCAI